MSKRSSPGESLQPSRFATKLAGQLLPDAEECARFLAALYSPAPLPQAIVWTQPRPESLPFTMLPRPDWYPPYVDLVPRAERPGAHALHESGAYYCLDPASVFEAQSFSAIDAELGTVIDLCAAPGGKSVLAAQALRYERLISNETIGKRIGMLISNLKRCDIKRCAVTSLDPSRVLNWASELADLVIVDAPCSGQSLLRKGQESAGCFHPSTVNLNRNRQRRIIACAAQCVAPGGWLAYMTCTFSPEENEEVVEWVIKKFPGFSAVPVADLAAYQSPFSELPCYRMWPMDRQARGEPGTSAHRGAQVSFGAGGFSALLRRSGDDDSAYSPRTDTVSPRWTSVDFTEP